MVLDETIKSLAGMDASELHAAHKLGKPYLCIINSLYIGFGPCEASARVTALMVFLWHMTQEDRDAILQNWFYPKDQPVGKDREDLINWFPADKIPSTEAVQHCEGVSSIEYCLLQLNADSMVELELSP